MISSETLTLSESDRAHSSDTPVLTRRSFRSGQSDQTPKPAEWVQEQEGSSHLPNIFVIIIQHVQKVACCVITISGRMTFTSNKSMEIEVFVDADPLVEAEKGKYRAVTAFFTYISLDKDNKPLPVPPLKLEGEEEQKRFEEGKVRYLQNKAKRLADKDRQQ
ncbi:cytosolic acyl coenzyme A thioester hydrolase-like [Sinocyclocheilus grahami]|uniref:cytosolic acyl coenzyme A thioester hydrolase-like n=1 Tax=Sinocyclocheilus grahami TaxID=75366 RepID=UPI0007ACD2A7|nr:PREDICTED: cytosolic acyl coenzyme A thioester hydrolase-like [Sinocyclocheilus grahami]